MARNLVNTRMTLRRCDHGSVASVLAALLFWCIATPVSAVLWDGGGVNSQWTEPANWQFNVLPMTADTATITNDTATINAMTIQNVPTVFAVELGLGSLPGGLVMTAGAFPADLTALTNVAVASAGSLTLTSMGAGTTLSTVAASTLSTAGTTTVQSRGRVDLSGQFTQTGGTVNLNGGVIDAALVVSQAGIFNASGDINADVNIGDGTGATATLALGASLDIDGNLKLAPDARLEVEFRDSSSGGVFDMIDATGTITLDGVLDLSVLAGATPVEGTTYTILNADGFEGSFDDIVGLPAGDGSWRPFIDDITTEIRVSFSALPGNMNKDFVIDELDVELFAWAIRDPNTYDLHFEPALIGAADSGAADMDGDNANTFSDIPLFLNAVAMSGGNSEAAFAKILQVLAGVPEPGAGIAALSAAVLLSPCVRRWQASRQRPRQ
jgi:hypothetical protein